MFFCPGLGVDIFYNLYKKVTKYLYDYGRAGVAQGVGR
jgi:hypothetical protein